MPDPLTIGIGIFTAARELQRMFTRRGHAQAAKAEAEAAMQQKLVERIDALEHGRMVDQERTKNLEDALILWRSTALRAQMEVRKLTSLLAQEKFNTESLRAEFEEYKRRGSPSTYTDRPPKQFQAKRVEIDSEHSQRPQIVERLGTPRHRRKLPTQE